MSYSDGYMFITRFRLNVLYDFNIYPNKIVVKLLNAVTRGYFRIISSCQN